MQDKIQEIMVLVVEYGNECAKFHALEPLEMLEGIERIKSLGELIESKLRELVREQEEAKKYLDALAMCMFEKHYAKDEPYASGSVKFELFDSLPGVISQIDNMSSGLERANSITNAIGVE